MAARARCYKDWIIFFPADLDGSPWRALDKQVEAYLSNNVFGLEICGAAEVSLTSRVLTKFASRAFLYIV